MTDEPNPLRLPPPARSADDALGERLALLARASTPTPVRRRAAWRLPLAAVVVVAGTGGLAYGAQSVVHHVTGPSTVVPGGDLSPRSSTTRPSSTATDATPTAAAGIGPTGGPTRPSHPAHPSHPAPPSHPAKPVHPTHPAHPSHPAHPTKAAHPSHPAPPAHPTPTRRPTRPTTGPAGDPTPAATVAE